MTIKEFFCIIIKYSPSPSNINYIWNFGSLLIIVLLIQIITGIFISFHYSSIIDFAFYRTIHIRREVYYGWLIRLFHINGASIFFILIFIHIAKAIINSSWKFINLWFSGIMIILLSIMRAFFGYVLPWGQISFWAATVITNILSAIPFIGKILVEWIWGGFSVSYPTLNRFFSFHFILPLIISLIVFIHILILHLNGSSNKISFLNLDKIRFDPYFTVKDLIGILIFTIIFLFILIYIPFYSIDSENFIEANPIITPIHIKPEWYFLFAYSILRSIPNKIGGVICLFISITIFIIKPFQIKIKIKFNWIKKYSLILFFYIFTILTYFGGKSIDYPFNSISIIFTIFYFIFSLII